MTGDLKTGYLLRAKPRNQFIAQLTGSVVAIFLNVGLFILFTTATPCILCVFLFCHGGRMVFDGFLCDAGTHRLVESVRMVLRL